MQLPDMNLLPALDALLREGSVTGAAAELNVSPSAMSRTLGRLRRVVGDPLLVPAGRGLALTPRARELRPRVEAALAQALAALQPPVPVDIAALEREFAVRASDAVLVVLGPAMTARIAREAPGVRLRILPEGTEDPANLRDRIDLDLGALPELPPDVRSCVLYRSGRHAVVLRADSPCLTDGQREMTLDQFVSLPHVAVSRRGRARGVVDQRLAELGLSRLVLATVPTHSAACFLALESDVLALLPREFAERAARAMPLAVLDAPLELPGMELGMAWHLRLEADPGHRWLREVVIGTARELMAGRDAATAPALPLP
ncbi:LysR family transcriptional regulator [Streptacidiphilus sp. PB12-B1b]|uniref:LysR family transcriptional regulator n=1 Tax=Streptacidiphilus sp. PB12-B1b TaxID=2705012 RepID=UPI0015FCBEC7|nr:LysR family transcriptional regulator [Streptacidiphilus sp. PB12-B1b]QMU78627.1 LysR family transcriptional regulator [Streptacidiphilus sp. PB12-B1b]